MKTKDDRIHFRKEDIFHRPDITKLPSLDQDSKTGIKSLRSLKGTSSKGYQRHIKANNKQIKLNLQSMIKSNIERNKLFEQCMNFNVLSSVPRSNNSPRFKYMYKHHSSVSNEKRGIMVPHLERNCDKKKHNRVHFLFESQPEIIQIEAQN